MLTAPPFSSARTSIADFPVTAPKLAEILQLASERTINMPTARQIFLRLIEEPESSAKAIVEAEGLAQVSDTSVIEEHLEAAVEANPKAAEDIRSGKYQTAGFFVGQIMRAMKGQGDPVVIGEVIAKRFGFDPALLAKKKKKK